MPPRPSRNLDRALLAAGRELFPSRGCAGLSVREVAEAAGVNLGMFHYHFKTREAFLRALLQQMYEEMYSQLSTQGAGDWGPVENLRAAMRFMGRFLRANRAMLSRILADALCGEAIAREYVRANFPRHLGFMQAIIVAGQKGGHFRAMPVVQAMGFCAGSLAAPIIFGGAVAESGNLGKEGARMITEALLTDEAIDERVDLAIDAISNPHPAPRKPTRRKPAKRGTP